MSQTTVGPDLLQALEVITELGVDTVGKDLRVLAVDNVALSVKEPCIATGQHNSSFSLSISLCAKSCSRIIAPSGVHCELGVWFRRTAGNLVLGRVLDDGDDTLELLGCADNVSDLV